jgi:bacterioferritin (cytochrome b1)
MGSKRAFAISRRRRDLGCAAAILSALTLAIAGCGSSDQGAVADSEKAADVEVLNVLLAQELTGADAYARLLPLLRGRALAAAAQFRGHEQAHVDAVTKGIRGLGGEAEAEAEELETPGPATAEEALRSAYEEENLALEQAMDAAPALNTPGPRTLAAALAASHAQHVAVLRQLLGEDLAHAVPEAFENGDVPPPPAPPDETG